MPKRVCYVGSSAEVELLLPSGEVVTLAKGSCREFPDEMAKEMLQSGAYTTTAAKAPEKE